jgi:hypothetical protein
MKIYYIFRGIQILYYILSFCEIEVQLVLIVTISIEAGDVSCLWLIIVSNKLSQGKPKSSIV